MTRPVAIALMCAGVLSLAGAAFSYWRDRPDRLQVCESAGERWEQCIQEVGGPELLTLTHKKNDDGLTACVEDAKTVEMYETCLPHADCAGFMQCLENYVNE